MTPKSEIPRRGLGAYSVLFEVPKLKFHTALYYFWMGIAETAHSVSEYLIPEEEHLETGETYRLAQLRHSPVHKSSVRQSDGSQRLSHICRKAMLINPTFG
ncbi:hypothetical protein AYI68_g5101 [Smittium mucronatum]|uniref:Uncharacterized protein n=1 Tax=Smittium mucronatum TaxID=133383 RepID=A0A1R0GVC9_9FUNG|nr:hypothetical protein AYI68_g5101 [Smittium mucronatum]